VYKVLSIYFRQQAQNRVQVKINLDHDFKNVGIIDHRYVNVAILDHAYWNVA